MDQARRVINSRAICVASRALLRTKAILAVNERPLVSSKIRCNRNGVTALPLIPCVSISDWACKGIGDKIYAVILAVFGI